MCARGEPLEKWSEHSANPTTCRLVARGGTRAPWSPQEPTMAQTLTIFVQAGIGILFHPLEFWGEKVYKRLREHRGTKFVLS